MIYFDHLLLLFRNVRETTAFAPARQRQVVRSTPFAGRAAFPTALGVACSPGRWQSSSARRK
jgi:hypothetical protein